MKYGDIENKPPENDSTRFICRVDVIPKLDAAKKLQNMVQQRVGYPARVMVAPTPILKMMLVQDDRRVILCNSAQVAPIENMSKTRQKVGIKSVDVKGSDLVVYALHPNIDKQTEDLYAGILRDWAGDLHVERIWWHVR
jgi:hypothetical protein